MRSPNPPPTTRLDTGGRRRHVAAMSEMSPEKARRRRVLWVRVAWAAGLLLTSVLIPLAFGAIGLAPLFAVYLPLFPLALFNILSGKLVAGWSREERFGWSFLVWMGYIFLTRLVLAQQSRSRYLCFYTLLCLILVLNAAGCNSGTTWR